MIYVHRVAGSQSARELSRALDAVRSKNPDRLRRRLKPHDKVVMWGSYLPDLPVTKVLNNVPLRSKYSDAVQLRTAGVRTIDISVERPTTTLPDPFFGAWVDATVASGVLLSAPSRGVSLADLSVKLNRVMNLQQFGPPTPIPEDGWLGRVNNHIAGRDLLNPVTDPDFYVKKEEFINEYRVHSFLGRSLRAGKKVPRTNASVTPFFGDIHPWIRSFDAGWQISYADEAGIRQAHRDLAHAAVKALGLDFGAVDIGELVSGELVSGELVSGELVVLEVNRAAGIEAGTTEAYVRGIRRWIDGTEV